MLERQVRQEPNVAAIPGACRWYLSAPLAFMLRISRGVFSSIAWRAQARWR